MATIDKINVGGVDYEIGGKLYLHTYFIEDLNSVYDDIHLERYFRFSINSKSSTQLSINELKNILKNAHIMGYYEKSMDSEYMWGCIYANDTMIQIGGIGTAMGDLWIGAYANLNFSAASIYRCNIVEIQ